MVRRHLGMSPAEWDALAWWQQRVYVEGLQQEFGGGEAAPGGADNRVVVDNDPGSLAAVGIQETWL